MAKFYGKIGYGESVETAPGVWQDVIVERDYYGDVLRNTRRLENGEHLNSDLTVSNSISIMADAYANEHFFNLKYIRWMGSVWTVSNVEVLPPRLLLQVGGVYNGETFTAPDASGNAPRDS